jgi:predicted amidophosphoribosyltransferase
LRQRNLLIASIVVAMKLSKLGLESTICPKCGRVQLTTERENALCRDCRLSFEKSGKRSYG